MNNTLTDLNNYLFEAMERLTDDSLTTEQMDRELKRAEGITKVAQQIIQNGELAYRTMVHMDEYGYNMKERAIPPMLKAEEKGVK